jgi:hypothetical protein
MCLHIRGDGAAGRLYRDSRVSFLDPPCCPNCHSLIDLTELWQAAPKSGNTVIDRVAIACPVCGVKLRVLQSRAFVTRVLAVMVPFALLMISAFVAPVTRGSIDYKIRMGIFAVVSFGAIFLQRRNNPRLLTVRLLQDNEDVRYPLARSPIPNPEDEAAPKSSALQLEPTKDDRPSWVCAKCGEENPDNFDECWKCQTWRVGEASE